MARYFVTNQDGIPFQDQPSNGYTKLQAISRIHREIEECIRLFGGVFSDYRMCFGVIDNKYRMVDFSDLV